MITDALLERWWWDFDTPLDEEERLDADYVIPGIVTFEKGSDRYDVWTWFDERHSKGLYWIMFYSHRWKEVV